jgi:hypothetical protein
VATASSSLRRLEKLTVRQVGVHCHAPQQAPLRLTLMPCALSACACCSLCHAMRPCAKLQCSPLTHAHTCLLQVGWGGSHPFPAFSSNVAATLQVLDIRHCPFNNIGSVRKCAQLTRIQMGSTMVSDLVRCLAVFVRVEVGPGSEAFRSNE